MVITGAGVISPIGIGFDSFWSNLSAGRSGIAAVSRLPSTALPDNVAGEVKDFTDDAVKKVYLKNMRKSLKVMCREIQLGVASATMAFDHSGLISDQIDHTRMGVEFGANQMFSSPSTLSEGCIACSEDGEFAYELWGTAGMGGMEPLWLLRYLPNMPACHIGIAMDARGPNNSLTLSEASGNLAMGEAYRIIARGSADIMLAGSTGTRIHPVKCVHAALWDELANAPADPAQRSRPFDRSRTGQVVGEGACTFVFEEEAHARGRGAEVFGTVLGSGSSCVCDRDGTPRIRQALANAMRSALRDAGLTPADIGHINAHGLAQRHTDVEESQAIHDAFGDLGDKVPVTAFKSYLGNSGAGSGTLELAASLAALRHGIVPHTLNYETPDPECPLNVVRGEPLAVANKTVLNLSVTRLGQASALVIRAE